MNNKDGKSPSFSLNLSILFKIFPDPRMKDSEYSGYETFCLQRKADLQRIASHSGGAHQVSDVKTEAWLMAAHMRGTRGHGLDWLKRQDQDLLLSHLYQHLVRYTERHLNHAVRLDYWHGNEEPEAPHPLLNHLQAPLDSNPLEALCAQEEELQWEQRLQDYPYSLAVAYVDLLRRFDNKMQLVADHLLISLSYCYRRYAKARILAERQHPISSIRNADRTQFLPGAWRSFRLQRAPLQLAFDFHEHATLALAPLENLPDCR